MIPGGSAAFGVVCVLAAVAATHAAEPVSIPGGQARLTQRGAATLLAITRHGLTTRAAFPADDGIFAGSLDRTRVVGGISGRVLILTTDYVSRPNGASHQCGAGIETMLRVIALRPVPRLTFRQRLASCWRTIDAGEVEWDPRTRHLDVERTAYETAHPTHLRTRYAVAPDGRVTAITVERLP